MKCATCGKEIEKDSGNLFECKLCQKVEVVKRDEIKPSDNFIDLLDNHHSHDFMDNDGGDCWRW